MPIHVDIRINDTNATVVHIGRMEDFKGKREVHTYRAVEGRARYDQGVEFKHRYSDGLLVCVEKGIAALNREEQA